MIRKTYIKYILAYLLITYVFQFLLFDFGFYNEVWNSSENYLYLFTVLSIFFVFSVFFYFKNPFNVIFHILYLITKDLSKFLFKNKSILISLCLLLSVLFFYDNSNSYRYLDKRLSDDVNYSLLLLAFLKSTIYAYTYIYFDLKFNGKNSKFFSIFDKIGILIVQGLSLTGVTSGIMFVFSFFIFFSYNPKTKYFSFKNILKILPILIVLLISIILSYAIKWKLHVFDTYEALKNIDLTVYFNYLVSRLSISYYSLMNFVNLNLSLVDFFENSLITLNNLSFRLDSILGGVFNISKPEINSINRLNYLYLSNGIVDSRSGTSPGIIASFLYQFGSFFGIILASAYTSFVFKVSTINDIKFSILKVFALILFFQGVFKAPFQAFLILDTNFLGLLLFLYYYKNYYSSQNLFLPQSKHLI